ncbi:hypothetical protein Psta_0409 [Pirellula staleyi DSM 6068]|uniref:Uncharacterized protein n=1 Tax=Pirellula staleyi (strain ATCC 27377 / DSM 6068 / ICPB 4128) TaxID=530564 RepID=D2R368_PIRSD|nr:hypothetical protein [Pirellula staleyi]ADB15099.1 hypothetical protein Psta_0409 [Pirellula staleyi DSM 6068]
MYEPRLIRNDVTGRWVRMSRHAEDRWVERAREATDLAKELASAVPFGGQINEVNQLLLASCGLVFVLVVEAESTAACRTVLTLEHAIANMQTFVGLRSYSAPYAVASMRIEKRKDDIPYAERCAMREFEEGLRLSSPQLREVKRAELKKSGYSRLMRSAYINMHYKLVGDEKRRAAAGA